MSESNVGSDGVREAFLLCRQSFVSVMVFSFFINALMLTPMFYMINVFDKAVSTGSFSTLFSLAVIAIFLYLLLGFFEWIRSQVLIHVGCRLDVLLAPRIYALCFESHSGALDAPMLGSRPLSDLNSLRQFVASPTATAVFDLPWIPLLLLIMFFFHPVLAAVALVCMVLLATVAILNQRYTTEGLVEANKQAAVISSQTQRNLRNAEAAAAMGMMSTLAKNWRSQQDAMLNTQAGASKVAVGYSALIKVLTIAMQSAAITTGAVLAIQQEITPGVMIGAALLLGKTLQPIQQAVTGWKSFVEAKENYQHLSELLSFYPKKKEKMRLPEIVGHVSLHGAFVKAPGGEEAILTDVSLEFQQGTVTMILGQSAAGKSSLVRAILGLWSPARGSIRIDGADASSYSRDELGPQVGYLPQDIELFDGSIAENIARFGDVDADLVVQAAIDAGVHEMILSLPGGYDHVVSSRATLSPGQRQRIALARALYSRPRLIILDEPNSNLDEAGEAALNSAIANMKALGSTIILVSHRQTALPLTDRLVIMAAGRIYDSGNRDDVVARLMQAKKAQQGNGEQLATPESNVSAM